MGNDGGWHKEEVLTVCGKDGIAVVLLQVTPHNQTFRLGRRRPGKATEWFSKYISVPNGQFSLHIGGGDLEVVVTPMDRITPLELELKGYTDMNHLQSDFPKVW